MSSLAAALFVQLELPLIDLLEEEEWIERPLEQFPNGGRPVPCCCARPLRLSEEGITTCLLCGRSL